MAPSRQRAIALKAPTLAEVLGANGFSRVYETLTAGQRQQMQRYLDAQVVDPEVWREAEEIRRKGTKYYGSLTVVDPAMQRKADRVMRQFISVGKQDDRVRIRLDKFLDEAAFAPTTDNPDEAIYLEKVRHTLLERGVWLRLNPKLVRDAQDPSRWVRDPRRYEVWLSLGPNGDAIPMKNGRIDREALMGTQLFGAGYYTEVHMGQVEKTLKREIDRLSSEIDDGMALHAQMNRIRGQAMPGVVAVSDALGGADYPDINIWQGPHKLVLRAYDLKNEGKTYGCRIFLVVAALATRDAARRLSRAIDKSTGAAESTVKVLKVVRTAAAVAEVALLVTGVGLAMRGAAAARTLASETAMDALAERELAKYVARNPEIASEINQVRWIRGPRGTVAGGSKSAARHEMGHGGFAKW